MISLLPLLYNKVNHLPILMNLGSSIFPSFTSQYEVQNDMRTNKDAIVVNVIAHIPFFVFKPIFLNNECLPYFAMSTNLYLTSF